MSNMVIEEIFDLYNRFGDEDYIGEPVSQLEHMLQAGELALTSGYDEEVVLAAFFHDIGHLLAFEGDSESMGGFGEVSHESKGADFLRARGFSERLAGLVESHVEAKRYLTFKQPEYYAKLSDASKKTLEFQGGMMTLEEAGLFEIDPLFEMKVKLRLWDDEAKSLQGSTVSLQFFKELAIKYLAAQIK